MNEYEQKHLEFIQNVITRMNKNSFQLKSSMITIVSAFLGLYAATRIDVFVLLALIPVAIFGGLDGYYLQQERKFRGIYNDLTGLSKPDERIEIRPFEMPIQKYDGEKNKKYSWKSSVTSRTIVWLYGPVFLLLGSIWFYLHYAF